MVCYILPNAEVTTKVKLDTFEFIFVRVPTWMVELESVHVTLHSSKT